MRVLLCLCFLLSAASLSLGQQDMFGGLMKQGADTLGQGAGIGADILNKGVSMSQDMMNQGVGMGMQIFKTATEPFKMAMTAAMKAAETATDVPATLLQMFRQGAEEAGKMTGGVAEQTQKMFQEGIKQVTALQGAGASPAAYTSLLKNMQG